MNENVGGYGFLEEVLSSDDVVAGMGRTQRAPLGVAEFPINSARPAVIECIGESHTSSTLCPKFRL